TDDGGLSRRSAGGVDAAHLLFGNREHAERVVLAQVLFGGERELGEVGRLAAVVGVHAGRVELRAVEGNVVVGVPEGPAQAFELKGAQLVDAQPFGRRQVVDRGGGTTSAGGGRVNVGHVGHVAVRGSH